jgi:hypothetical protein
VRTEIDIETLLRWAFRDELSKRQTSAAEGLWDHVAELGQLGGTEIDRGHSDGAQRYAYIGSPDPDAVRLENAIASLGDLIIDWPSSFDAIAGDLAGLITVNDVSRPWISPRTTNGRWGAAGDKALKAWFGPSGARTERYRDRPRDVLLVAALRPSVLVTLHAIKGTRPDWNEDPPKPFAVPALKGTNAMIVGDCRGRNLYSSGSYCPLSWEPSPLDIVLDRADYIAWHDGLTKLAETVQLEKFAPLPPKASRTPWQDAHVEPGHDVKPVIPTSANQVDRWGTLPLTPERDRKGSPLRTTRAGPVTYPLRDATASASH